MKPEAPEIDFAAISPLVALLAGSCVILLLGLARAGFIRTQVVPALTLVTLGVTAGLGIWRFGDETSVIAGSLRMDDLTHTLLMLFVAAGVATVLLGWRSLAAREAGHGEFHSLLLACVLGMVLLVAAQNLVAVFIGYELLSIPLYVLCATELRRERSLESGLKYLIIGSVGSAVLLYGLAFVYGAAGTTDFGAIARAIDERGLADDVLFLTGVALAVVGLAFKASVAPFHQWTPDVYEGAPTPITAFMAVATKAAAFGVFLRLFDVALIGAASTWAPALAALAVITIVVGNVGALGQSSLKRMLAYSSVAQAGYMLAGVVVSTQLGVQAVVFYLAAYLLMNLAAFGVIVVRERETDLGDDISSLYGLGASRPWLAWPMTIAMLSLAGFPATAGFFGKINLIQAVVEQEYAWLGVVIVLGSALSLAYYLRVVAAVWMRAPGEAAAAGAPAALPSVGGRPLMAGGAPGPDEEHPPRGAGDETGARRAGDPPSKAGGAADPAPHSAGRGGAGESGESPLEGESASAQSPVDGGYSSAREDEGADGEPVGARAAGSATGEGQPDPAHAAAEGRTEIADPGPAPAASAGPALRRVRQPEALAVAIVCTLGTLFFGVYPSPLLDFAREAGNALTNLF